MCIYICIINNKVTEIVQDRKLMICLSLLRLLTLLIPGDNEKAEVLAVRILLKISCQWELEYQVRYLLRSCLVVPYSSNLAGAHLTFTKFCHKLLASMPYYRSLLAAQMRQNLWLAGLVLSSISLSASFLPSLPELQ